MDNPFALVVTLTLAAAIIAVAVGILGRLFPSPGPPAPSAPPVKFASSSDRGPEAENDEERSLSC